MTAGPPVPGHWASECSDPACPLHPDHEKFYGTDYEALGYTETQVFSCHDLDAHAYQVNLELDLVGPTSPFAGMDYQFQDDVDSR